MKYIFRSNGNPAIRRRNGDWRATVNTPAWAVSEDYFDDRKPLLPTHTVLARMTTPNEDIAALSCRFLRQRVSGSEHSRMAHNIAK